MSNVLPQVADHESFPRVHHFFELSAVQIAHCYDKAQRGSSPWIELREAG
jgi:hypothetical protein